MCLSQRWHVSISTLACVYLNVCKTQTIACVYLSICKRERWLACVYLSICKRERWLACVYLSICKRHRWFACVYLSVCKRERWLACVHLRTAIYHNHSAYTPQQLVQRLCQLCAVLPCCQMLPLAKCCLRPALLVLVVQSIHSWSGGRGLGGFKCQSQ